MLPGLVGTRPVAASAERDEAIPERSLIGHCEAGGDADGLYLAVGEGRVSGAQQPTDLVLVRGLLLQ